MAAVAGYLGQVKIGANVVANIRSDNFDLQAVVEDITAMLATPTGFKVFLPTLNEAAFSITANWDPSDTNGQVAMETAWLNRTLLNFIMSPNNATNTYTFSGYIKKISVKVDVQKVVEASYDIQPSGTISFV